MNKIKVIHLWKDFSAYYGVHDQLLTLGRFIDRDRFDYSVAVFSYQDNEIAHQFRNAGIQVHDLKIRWKQNPLNVMRIANFLKKERPHVFHTYCLNTNVFGLISGKMAGVPAIIPTELTQKNQANTWMRRVRDIFLNRVSINMGFFADRLVYISENVRQNWIGSRFRDKSRIIYPPFNYEKFRLFEKEPYKKSTMRKEYVIGIVARLSEEKRHVDLLDAMPHVLKDFAVQLVIVGTGPQEALLRSKAAQLGIANRVRFTGHIANVFSELRNFDLFVLPSRTEGVSISVVEAMAMGLPVVGTAVGGLPEAVVDNKTGILVPPRNPELLAASIRRILGNEDLREAMGKAGRDRAMQLFHPREFARKHDELYTGVLSEKNIVLGKR